jgi:acyl-CoA synthetase (AMP-forming)/AMP-acid ligase II
MVRRWAVISLKEYGHRACEKRSQCTTPQAKVTAMFENQILCDLLEARAKQTPTAVAIAAPDRTPLTYGRLHEHTQHVVHQLNAFGIGRQDRVAMVLPNGPEMAVAFLAVASAATSAPLNPAYRQQEFAVYLSDLAATALLVMTGTDSSAIAAAQARDILVIELTPLVDEAAGLFTLSGRSRPLTGPAGLAQPDDVALMLPTSGTTSRPKYLTINSAIIFELF